MINKTKKLRLFKSNKNVYIVSKLVYCSLLNNLSQCLYMRKFNTNVSAPNISIYFNLCIKYYYIIKIINQNTSNKLLLENFFSSHSAAKSLLNSVNILNANKSIANKVFFKKNFKKVKRGLVFLQNDVTANNSSASYSVLFSKILSDVIYPQFIYKIKNQVNINVGFNKNKSVVSNLLYKCSFVNRDVIKIVVLANKPTINHEYIHMFNFISLNKTLVSKILKRSTNIGLSKKVQRHCSLKFFNDKVQSQNLFGMSDLALLPQSKLWSCLGKNKFAENSLFVRSNFKSLAVRHYMNKFTFAYLPKKVMLSKIKNMNLNKSVKSSLLYVYYICGFLEFFLKSKIWFKISSKLFLNKRIVSLMVSSCNKNMSAQRFIGKELFLLEMYQILWIAVQNRSLEFFAGWLKTIMEKIHFRKHKKIVKLIASTLKKNKKLYFDWTNSLGFAFDIRGKLGVTGNSKKRHYAFTIGKVSLTTKKYPLHYYFNTVRTDTGVLGLSYFLMTKSPAELNFMR